MAEDGSQERPPVSSDYGDPSKTDLLLGPRQGLLNREQRRLRLVLTAFNVAKVLAVAMLFLLIVGTI